MKKAGGSIIPEEVRFLEKIANKIYVIKPSRVVIEISPNDLRKAVNMLKENLGDTGFYVNTIVGTDYPKDKAIQVDYYITLVPSEKTFVLRTRISRENPVIDSLIDLVPGVFPGECETHDLLGVVFNGNRYLKRGFFAPADIVDKNIYPLRKDSGV